MLELKNKMNILDDEGKPLCPSYSFKNNYIYNRENIAVRESRIKEWEFYQFIEGDYVLQLTFGHASLFDNFATTLFNIKTNERHEFSMLKLHHKNEFIYPNSELDHTLTYKSKNYNISFSLKDNKRILDINGKNKKYKDVKVHVEVDNDYNNDKMNILTPFNENEHMFFLNYKENYYQATATVKYDDFEISFKNMKGLIDSGRGYWPYKHEWVWSNMTTTINKVNLGWNLGFGFGNLKYATENMVFINGKGIHLDNVLIDMDLNDTYNEITISNKEGHLYAKLTPIYDNFTKTKVLYIDNSCHQVFFKVNGYIKDDLKKYELKDVICFLEHAHNKW